MVMSDVQFVLKFRDTINEMIDKRIAKLRPAPRDAFLVSVDHAKRTARCRWVDQPDGDAFFVRWGGNMIPNFENFELFLNNVRIKVRVEGQAGNRIITAVYLPILAEQYEHCFYNFDVAGTGTGILNVGSVLTANGFDHNLFSQGVYLLVGNISATSTVTCTGITGFCSVSTGGGGAGNNGSPNGEWRGDTGWWDGGSYMAVSYQVVGVFSSDHIDDMEFDVRVFVSELNTPGTDAVTDPGSPYTTDTDNATWTGRFELLKVRDGGGFVNIPGTITL